MLFHGLGRDEARRSWRPAVPTGSSRRRAQDFAVVSPLQVLAAPGRGFWDPATLRQIPGAVIADDRPGAPPPNIYYVGNVDEAGQVIHAYQSTWLPASLLEADQRERLVDALTAAAGHSQVEIYFGKGLAGGQTEAIEATQGHRDEPCRPRRFPRSPSVGPVRRRPIPAMRTSARRRRPGATPPPSLRRWANCASSRRAPPLMSGRPTTSSRIGRTRSGATTTRGYARSNRNTIPMVFSSSITASAARTGAPTGSPALNDRGAGLGAMPSSFGRWTDPDGLG